MTVRLLAALGQYPANAIVTFAAAVEASLVAEKIASTDLTGGISYQAPVSPGRAGEAARWVTDESGSVVDLMLPGSQGQAGLNFQKLLQLFGDDEMILGNFANRPAATSVAPGKEFMATDLGNMRWVSDGTQWILVKPCQIVGDATQQSIVDSVGQGTTESTLYTLNLPANALGDDDGLQLDIIWSCSNSAAAKRIRSRFGGTVLFNVDLTTHLVYRQSVKLRNRNSKAAQVSQGNSTTNFGPIGSVDVQSFTVDFSAAQALTITGQFPVAGTGTNDLTLEEVTIVGI